METCNYCYRSFSRLGGHINRCPEREEANRLKWIKEGQRLAKQEIHIQNLTINNIVQNTLALNQSIDSELNGFFEKILPFIQESARNGLKSPEIKQQLLTLAEQKGTKAEKAIAKAINNEESDFGDIPENVDASVLEKHLNNRIQELENAIDTEVNLLTQPIVHEV